MRRMAGDHLQKKDDALSEAGRSLFFKNKKANFKKANTSLLIVEQFDH